MKQMERARVMEIGEPGGPRLIALASPEDPAAASPAAFREAWREALEGEELLPLRFKEVEGIGVGLGRRLGLWLVHPRGMRIPEALRAVEERMAAEGHGPLPAAWAAPFLLLQRLGSPLPDLPEAEIRLIGRTLQALSLLLRAHPGPDAPRRPERQTTLLRRLETRRRLPRLWTAANLEEIQRILGETPMGGVDAALAWIEAGAALWQPEEIPPERPTLSGFLAAATLAEISGGAGEGILAWTVWDWPMWWDIVQARRAGRPLPPPDWAEPRFLPLRRELVRRVEGTPRARWEEEARLAAGLFRALMDIAEREARYVPQGRLRVRADLPPLRARGVAAFRVAADPHGLWLRPVDPAGREGEIFRLDRTLPPRPDLAGVDPLWLAAGAALWHDLTVGVPRPPVARRRPPSPARETAGEVDEALPPGPGRERRMVLPRIFRVTAAGEGAGEIEAEWGTPETRRRLERAAHMVRGHLRRLPAGWKARSEAHRLAAGFGVVIPEGFTFVRPHLRGRHRWEPADEAPPEPEAVARGLASLMLLPEAKT